MPNRPPSCDVRAVVSVFWLQREIAVGTSQKLLKSSLGIYKNSHYQHYLVPSKISIKWFYTRITMFLWHQKKAVEKSFLTISWLMLGSKKLTPHHPFPLQNPGIAASDRFWPSPPRNLFRAQFGSASAITIPLIHSWYGPLVGMVSMFSFE